MSTFWCWEAENEESDDAEQVDAYDAECAAEKYIESRWSDFDHPETSSVDVRDAQGTVTRWTVTTEPTVVFHASRKKLDVKELP
ncbi:MAG TPA: hypothetical protein VH062_01975 [Polyangiaceae bacterium]|jgi:hypothetical protein|nr:hypothetical protein [Polyangiaceae bacterium]